jgi:hypothetical protein
LSQGKRGQAGKAATKPAPVWFGRQSCHDGSKEAWRNLADAVEKDLVGFRVA